MCMRCVPVSKLAQLLPKDGPTSYKLSRQFQVQGDRNNIVACYVKCTTGASIIAYSTLGVPCYNYSFMGPKTLF